mgnify:CR=1 FL=1
MSDSRRRSARADSKPLVLTMGEPSGIGGEIALKAWRAAQAGPFFTIDSPERLRATGTKLSLAVPIVEIANPAEASGAYKSGLPVLPLSLAAPVRLGEPDPKNAPAVLDSIERAVAIAIKGEAAAIVTNPIHKKALYGAGFRYPGHTEFLAALAGASEPPVMMLACSDLRVIPVTVHLPLAKAIAMLSSDAIVHAGRVAAAALRRDFGIAAPRLAVAGLNPHAGEYGALGSEEEHIIAPAVAALAAGGIDVTGPSPADTLFHATARERYDVALCMYHDQALIPLKTLDFERGVHITVGLPFVRTSPDHGTAFAIAGQGVANPTSLIAALETARRMADARAMQDAVA